jgi:predicted RNA-binding Zn-ribbon protein involved in translation (DUF1610 family)
MQEAIDFEPSVDDAAPATRTAACESCGAPVEPEDRFCGSCGGEQAAAAEMHEPPPAQKHLRCENCGAEVAIDPQQRSYTCPFCDSNYVAEFTLDQTGRQPPEFVVGFAVAPEKAMEIFRRWLCDNSWFRPGDLNLARIAEKLKGIYLPFWSFSMHAESRWSANIGEYWYRTETYTTTQNGKRVTRTRRVRETEWWPLAGQHHRYYSGFLVSGSRGLSQRDAERVKPFHLAALRRYRPYYLAGWLSEEYSVERDEALAASKQEFLYREQRNVAAFLPGDTHSELRVETGFSDVNSDLILLPIYLLSYRYGDKLYRFMINGQTGKAVGDKPWSWKRITAAIVAVATFLAIFTLLFALLSR